jgi:integrase
VKARLYKRDNGYYYVIVSWKNEKGVYKQRWMSTKTKKKTEAEKWLEKQRAEIALGHFVEGDDAYFTDFIQEWLKTRVKGKLAVSTYEAYEGAIRNHIIPYFIKLQLKLRELKPYHFQNFYDELTEKGLSPSSVRRIHFLIGRALKFAMKMQMLGKNPAQYADLPKMKKYKPTIYNGEQLEKLKERVKDTEIEAPVILAMALGLRKAEALGLRWENVDFIKNRIFICEIRRESKSGEIIKEPKTEKSTRYLPMPDELATFLKKIKDKQEHYKEVFGNEYIDRDYVCTMPNGQPIGSSKVNKLLNKITDELELPRIRFHDLRHANATYLFKQGLSLKEIQAWLGHSVLSTTADIYTHLDEESKEKGAVIINNFLTPKETEEKKPTLRLVK